MALRGPHATAAAGQQHHTIRPAIQLRRIETDQIEIEALVAQPSQILLNQGTRNNPVAMRVETASFGRSDQPSPARRTGKKRSAFTSFNVQKDLWKMISAKKLQEQEPPSLENR
jgi:hypothetical protein